jgi:hypothetical protein
VSEYLLAYYKYITASGIVKRRSGRELAETLFDKESVGTIRELQSLAYDLRYSRSLPTEEGRQIILDTPTNRLRRSVEFLPDARLQRLAHRPHCR